MKRWRAWQRYSYLSSSERRLNRALWALFLGGAVYAVFQHVVLAEMPEVISSGARWGDLLYDIAIAYVGSFVFYLLVVRLPLRRDRRTVYRHLARLIDHAVSIALALMEELNAAADVDPGKMFATHVVD